jgi:GR25 family glycosyltransferase involved in LPS biosynthesis
LNLHTLSTSNEKYLAFLRRNAILSSSECTIGIASPELHLKIDLERAKSKYGNVSKGMMNCALGHRKIWDKLNDTDFVVFEDDAILSISCLSVLKVIEKEYSTSRVPTIVILGRSKTVRKYLWFENLKFPLRNKKRINGIEIGTKKQNFFGTVGYYGNKQAAAVLQKFPYSVYWKPDDWDYLINSGLTVVHLRNPIVWEDLSSESLTDSDMHVQHNPYKLNTFIREWVSAFKGLLIR